MLKPRRKSSGRNRVQQPVGAALIGAGTAGTFHAEALCQLPGVRLRAVVDARLEKAHHVARRLSADRYTTQKEEVLEDPSIDLVVIATPPDSHVALSIAVLRAGKHLLLEKPLGRNLNDADCILEAAGQAPSAVGVALVHRYNSNRLAARVLIKSGAIGNVRRMRYHCGRNMYDDSRFREPENDERSWLVDERIAGGGILPSSAIHTLSLISFLLGDPRFLHVSGSVRNLHSRSFTGIEDDVALLIALDNGVEVDFAETWAYDLPYEMSIEGDDGRLMLSGPDFNTISLAGECRGPIPPELRSFFDGRRLCCQPDELAGLFNGGFGALAADMVEACRERRPSRLPDLLHGRNMRAVIAGALEASALGHRAAISWRRERSMANVSVGNAENRLERELR